uniref:Protein tweety homolog n=1 Tax=Grammatophora oceanica TaxID=210454 RepID=A0A7S1UXK6_9STRA|mmetsp:Transcript_28576/g.42084  ORF Transcript_28576/g.42084 Transcript_28576/m.42084 type:complete len:558 (+) Transcript_28576:70-1743(+)|eukprot:CAMPEP_0194048136 /NCGR_PEP_ID=MMETSP0009_2-20130614/26742_1 /TAXON_ID=210454 /ORGANISM="Grammatophora oceanica, Strain CCMP 410" /LENGTH=557 /DNA_ID=CAMNT_0038693949 /DNA_START=66 /DNA_END=1739 /DNA_ORIENTATION=+
MADDGIEPVSYVAASATASMRAAPRFNHPKDFSLLFSEDEGEVTDYAIGLIFGGCMIVSLFLLWAFILLLFKCLGQRKVGFLSGAPFVQQSHKTESKRPFRVRVAFLAATLVFITFTILLVTNGITNLQDTATTVVNANSEIQQLQRDASSIVSSLDSLIVPTRDIRGELVKLNEGSFCPDDPSLTQDTGIDFDNLIDEAIVLLEQLGDFLEGDLDDLETALDTAEDTTKQIEDQADNIELNDWQSLVIIIPYVLIPSFLLVALMMTWFDASFPTYTCVVQWFFLPLFILITSIAFVLSAAVLTGAVANADFCSGESPDQSIPPNPDETVLSILSKTGVQDDELVYKMVTFYVKQCISEDPFGFIGEYRDEIQIADEQIRSLTDAMDSVTLSRLNFVCGRDFAPVEALLSSMSANLDILRDNALAALELLRCSRITPIYTATVYRGTCTFSVTGVTWLFASSLVVGVMGMLMITLRSSMWDEVYDENQDGMDRSLPLGETEELDDYKRSSAYQPGYAGDWKDDDECAPPVSRSITRGSTSSRQSYSDPSYGDPASLY